MNNYYYAPVIIPTLSRYEHFKRCIESLGVCPESKYTELFIGLDFPPSEKYKDGYNKIKSYITTIDKFRNIVVLTSEKNIGAINNMNRLIDHVFSKGYDRLIFSEDDNEFSPFFLDYQNKLLIKYKDNLGISAICGYSCPIFSDENIYSEYDIYLSHYFIAWGFGMWRDKPISNFKQFDYSTINEVKKFIRNPINAYKAYFLPFSGLDGLMNAVRSKYIHFDVMIAFSNLYNNRYCIFPSISLVRNHGHDGTGINCDSTTFNFFKEQLISFSKKNEINSIIDDSIVKKAIKTFSINYKKKTIKEYIYYICYYIKIIIKY